MGKPGSDEYLARSLSIDIENAVGKSKKKLIMTISTGRPWVRPRTCKALGAESHPNVG